MTSSRTLSVVFLSGLLSLPATAYIRETTGQGTPLARTDYAGIQVLVNNSMVAGATNTNGIAMITGSSNPMAAVTAAASQWTHVPTTAAVFNAPQPTTLSNNPNDGQYVVTIQDTAANRSTVGAALAVTLFSYTGSGVITDSDIIFNPSGSPNYLFSTDQTPNTTDLQSVLVHEMGHSLGANHSLVISATMFQSQPPCDPLFIPDCILHHTLSADDAAFVTNAYPGASAAAQTGSITGSVAVSNGTAIGGAYVIAVDPVQGITIGGLSNLQTGAYQLNNIPPGNYLVYAQPANGPVMPSNLGLNISNTTFRTTFSGGNQSPATVSLTAGGTSTANISVDVPQTALQIVLFGHGRAGGSGDYAYNGGAQTLPSASSADLLLFGPGMNSSVTASQIRLLGPGVTLHANTLHVDNFISVNVNGTSYSPLRFTVDIAPLATSPQVTVAVVNGTDAAAYSAGLVLQASATAPSSLSVTKSHIGVFTQGQTSGASYTVTVSNAASAAATTGTVTVTDNPPTGMSVALMTGTGWGCINNVCTRTDALAPGASYPPITANVNIALTAASSLTNQVTVSGGNSASASASDVTTIEPAVVGAVTVTGISNAAGFQAVIPSGSFVSVYGTNLSPIGYDDWSKSIVNGNLPTQIDGVSLTIGGKAAYIFAISPTQINAQAPDIGSGPVQVIVNTPNGVSAGFTANGQLYNPAFWPWPNKQPVATHPDYSIAAKNGSFTGLTTVPAKPGEIITLWGTGFGPTSPAVPAGQLPGATAGSQTQLPVTVTVNSAPVTVLGAAISSYPADYQVAIVIPASMTAGDYPLVATINGVSTPQVTLTVAP